MAITITWELDILPINLATKEARVIATRTEIDDVALTTLINTYEDSRTIIDTVNMSNNIPILDKIWAKHQTRLTKEAVIDAFVSALEVAGKTNLEARE